jgi:hypothetical protein
MPIKNSFIHTNQEDICIYMHQKFAIGNSTHDFVAVYLFAVGLVKEEQEWYFHKVMGIRLLG